jgi:hypothetical protein
MICGCAGEQKNIAQTLVLGSILCDAPFLLGYQRRLGVWHCEKGRKTASQGSEAACTKIFFVLTTRRAQVNVHINETRESQVVRPSGINPNCLLLSSIAHFVKELVKLWGNRIVRF